MHESAFAVGARVVVVVEQDPPLHCSRGGKGISEEVQECEAALWRLYGFGHKPLPRLDTTAFACTYPVGVQSVWWFGLRRSQRCFGMGPQDLSST
jgi:hypothetical protein